MKSGRRIFNFWLLYVSYYDTILLDHTSVLLCYVLTWLDNWQMLILVLEAPTGAEVHCTLCWHSAGLHCPTPLELSHA